MVQLTRGYEALSTLQKDLRPEGEFAEGHQLDECTERRVPKKSIVRPITRGEAAILLKRFE